MPLAFSIVASLIARVLEAVCLGWLNQIMGAVMGAVKTIFVLSLLIFVFEFFDSDNQILSETKKESSILYKPIEAVLYVLFF